MTALKIAAQVYSVREQAEKDFPGTMRALKECGYQGVELAGLYGHTPGEVRDCLDSEGLIPVSAHVALDLFLENMDKTIEDYRMIGCRYIGIPYMPEERLWGGEKYRETCAFLKKLSAACRKQGMTLLYHNHTSEFRRTSQGTYVLDELFSEMEPEELQPQLDTCWVKVAGEDPVAYLEKYRNRCPVVHMKDFRREGEHVELVALGKGEQNIAAIAAKALECGAQWLVVEQDDHPYGEPMDNMRESIRCLTSAV